MQTNTSLTGTSVSLYSSFRCFCFFLLFVFASQEEESTFFSLVAISASNQGELQFTSWNPQTERFSQNLNFYWWILIGTGRSLMKNSAACKDPFHVNYPWISSVFKMIKIFVNAARITNHRHSVPFSWNVSFFLECKLTQWKKESSSPRFGQFLLPRPFHGPSENNINWGGPLSLRD